MTVATGQSSAMVGGTETGQDAYRSVGLMLADFDPASPGPDAMCSGTLVAPRVFLTAGHCTAFLESQGIHHVSVTFDAYYDENLDGVIDGHPGQDATTTSYTGTTLTHPQLGANMANLYDMGAVVLDRAPVGVAPAQLPERPTPDNPVPLLDQLRADRQLETFEAVGYGMDRDPKTGGLTSLDTRPVIGEAMPYDARREVASETFLSLQDSRLKASMNPSTGNGGTCYRDSGGPHFLHGTDVVVAITDTGDTWCRAMDSAYRIDQTWSWDFLGPIIADPDGAVAG